MPSRCTTVRLKGFIIIVFKCVDRSAVRPAYRMAELDHSTIHNGIATFHSRSAAHATRINRRRSFQPRRAVQRRGTCRDSQLMG